MDKSSVQLGRPEVRDDGADDEVSGPSASMRSVIDVLRVEKNRFFCSWVFFFSFFFFFFIIGRGFSRGGRYGDRISQHSRPETTSA